ncbi:DUF6934 family protein [Pedobacter gandavensis]|uniref:DUF6934 family protein n=1 Tax=Pedobacter gandavensis TaxID=2679963 RepID=UPI00292CD7E7|nr:hypothetical protein [Pedobacter gandavensis]
MRVTINFDDIYEVYPMIGEQDNKRFYAPQKDGSIRELLVIITEYPDPDLPNVFNLGFGPPNDDGGFIDNVRLWHKNLNKVFSTILFISLSFLKQHPYMAIGLDGSDDLRTRFYHCVLKQNSVYLKSYFMPFGIDWYVRIFRNGSYEQNPDGSYIDRPLLMDFDSNRENRDLYRYYVFILR